MPLIPFAEKRLIRPGSSDPFIIPIGIILHVDAGNVPDLYDFFRYRSNGIESHGHVRRDGHVYQYRDTDYEADANYKANSFYKDGKRYGYLSFETQGYGDGTWTDEQLFSIKQLILWGHREHNIPLRVCKTSTDPGVGYHTLFGAPSAWTPVAKSCPGPERKKQFHNIIEPWLETRTKPKEWDEMVDKNEMKAVIQEAVPGSMIQVKGKSGKLTKWKLETVLRNMESDQDAINSKLDSLTKKVDRLVESLDVSSNK